MLVWMIQHSKEGGKKKLVLGLIRKPENPRSDSQGCWIGKIGCKCLIDIANTFGHRQTFSAARFLYPFTHPRQTKVL